jgi:hypothetical protein
VVNVSQELAAGSISLDTSLDDISTISTLWQLQPFTDEAAVAAVWEAAAAAVAAALPTATAT